jgi:uncharacterized protein (TIGR02996 family)
MTPEEKAFWAAIKAAPADHLAKLVFADWLAERSERPALEYAMRWAGVRGRHPLVTPARGLASWAFLRKGQHRPAWPHQLPRLVYERLRGGATYDAHRRYVNTRAAFESLAAVLQSGRDVFEIDGKGVK